MSKKYIICLALCAIALIGLLFMPWVSIMGQEATLSDIMDLLDAMDVDVAGDLGGILIIMGIAGGVVGLVGGIMRKKSLVLTGSIIGAAGILILVLAVNAYVQDMIGSYLDIGLTDWVGGGIWLAIVGYIAAAVAAGAVKEDF